MIHETTARDLQPGHVFANNGATVETAACRVRTYRPRGSGGRTRHLAYPPVAR